MPSPYAMNSMNQADWMQTAPSPYQQGMMSQAPKMAPNDTSFGDRVAAQGQQLANAPQAGMAGGVGGARMGGMAGGDQKMMADALRKGAGNLAAAVNPYLPGTQQATADQFGTNPYSDQSMMIAKQNQGLM